MSSQTIPTLAQILLGIPACFGSFARVIRDIPDAGALVSANAFFNHRSGRFRRPAQDLFHGVPVALDSAGFVAMVRYWFYRWTLEQYVDLAGCYPWLWWAAPDFCCEREVARDRAEVRHRIAATAAKLAWTVQVAADRGVKAPMPVLQGWRPDDYLACADLISRFMDLPALVGLGSMCRRHLAGREGAIAIIDRVDAVLPRHVRFHLFGVKGAVAVALRGHPRIASLDSQAFEAAARRIANQKRRDDPSFSCSVRFRTEQMREWHSNLSASLAAPMPIRPPVQTAFFLGAV